MIDSPVKTALAKNPIAREILKEIVENKAPFYGFISGVDDTGYISRYNNSAWAVNSGTIHLKKFEEYTSKEIAKAKAALTKAGLITNELVPSLEGRNAPFYTHLVGDSGDRKIHAKYDETKRTEIIKFLNQQI